MTTVSTPDEIVGGLIRRYRQRLSARAGLIGGLAIACWGAALWRLAGQTRDIRVLSIGLGVGVAVFGWVVWLVWRQARRSELAVETLDRQLRLDARLLTAAQFAGSPERPALYDALLEDVRKTIDASPKRLPPLLDWRGLALAALLLLAILWPMRWPPTLPTQLAQLTTPTPPASIPPPNQPPEPTSTSPQSGGGQSQPQDQRGGEGQSGQQQSPGDGAKGQSPADQSRDGSEKSDQAKDQASSQGRDASSSQSAEGQRSDGGQQGGEDGREQPGQQADGQGGKESAKRPADGAGKAQAQAGQSPEQSNASRGEAQGEQSGAAQAQQADRPGQSGGDQARPSEAQRAQSQASQQDAASKAGDRDSSTQQAKGSQESTSASDRQTAAEQAAERQGDRGAGKSQSAEVQRREAQGGGEAKSGERQETGLSNTAESAALKRDIQQLLQELSGQVTELQAQMAKEGHEVPVPGTGPGGELLGEPDADATKNPEAATRRPVQLEVDGEASSTKRAAGGIGDQPGEVGDAAPGLAPEDATLAPSKPGETLGTPQRIPPEYRPVFERLSSKSGSANQ